MKFEPSASLIFRVIECQNLYYLPEFVTIATFSNTLPLELQKIERSTRVNFEAKVMRLASLQDTVSLLHIRTQAFVINCLT
jgi:uncharacterized protein YpmS